MPASSLTQWFFLHCIANSLTSRIINGNKKTPTHARTIACPPPTPIIASPNHIRVPACRSPATISNRPIRPASRNSRHSVPAIQCMRPNTPSVAVPRSARASPRIRQPLPTNHSLRTTIRSSSSRMRPIPVSSRSTHRRIRPIRNSNTIRPVRRAAFPSIRRSRNTVAAIRRSRSPPPPIRRTVSRPLTGSSSRCTNSISTNSTISSSTMRRRCPICPRLG